MAVQKSKESARTYRAVNRLYKKYKAAYNSGDLAKARSIANEAWQKYKVDLEGRFHKPAKSQKYGKKADKVIKYG